MKICGFNKTTLLDYPAGGLHHIPGRLQFPLSFLPEWGSGSGTRKPA